MYGFEWLYSFMHDVKEKSRSFLTRMNNLIKEPRKDEQCKKHIKFSWHKVWNNRVLSLFVFENVLFMRFYIDSYSSEIWAFLLPAISCWENHLLQEIFINREKRLSTHVRHHSLWESFSKIKFFAFLVFSRILKIELSFANKSQLAHIQRKYLSENRKKRFEKELQSSKCLTHIQLEIQIHVSLFPERCSVSLWKTILKTAWKLKQWNCVLIFSISIV